MKRIVLNIVWLGGKPAILGKNQAVRMLLAKAATK
jgi:hypothetical protein